MVVIAVIIEVIKFICNGWTFLFKGEVVNKF